ncbi:GTPase of the mitochondrial inner membrane that associates with the large ribosomal subunit [Thelotrema lepadinum]|nr:GTPase of the mitochondrial inner membrane that associates with the large ribosomal subunit [Thelotrema lepadinum]
MRMLSRTCALIRYSWSHQKFVSRTSSSLVEARLNPSPEDYNRSIFADHCNIVVEAGSGGHGCVSFLREKFIADGPPNGGDGGTGGNIYVQAVEGETSLHKIARRGLIRAGRGRNGQGKSKGGQRGEDVLLRVPIGTVVRETSRHDPVAIEEQQAGSEDASSEDWERNKWLLAPSAMPSEFTATAFPALPRPRRSNLVPSQPSAPINLDLSKSMAEPMLLAAGAVGGLGNPRFATKSITRPKFATRGDRGMRLELALELKLLADLGFVGLPNAGKSTLLRALSGSRARIGDWAFTTLQPNIGTVILDDNKGRPIYEVYNSDGSRRTNFTIADIPGLVPDAHLDRGLGLDFLRHVERAKVLAFVIDLSTGDAVETLKVLKMELKEFEKLKEFDLNQFSQRLVDFRAGGTEQPFLQSPPSPLPPLTTTPISSKPWFVVANKADLQGTEDNFRKLKDFVDQEWGATSIPVSANRAEGTDKIPEVAASLLN